MRTTLTLDDDVAALLNRIRTEQRRGLKEIVNQALRCGLREMESSRKRRKTHRTRGRDLGRCLLPSLDDVAEVLAVAEEEGFR